MTFEPDYPANKPEEVNPRWFNYANIDGRTAQILMCSPQTLQKLEMSLALLLNSSLSNWSYETKANTP